MNSDSDSDVGPSNRPGAAQNLANMASQFLGTGHSQAAQSIFIGQPGHSQYSDNSDYGLGALDPFALEESPGPSSSRGQHQPAVLNPTAESIYGFQSETLSDPDEPRPPTKTESKDALRSGAHPQEHQQQQPRQPEQQIQPQDTSWLAVYFVALLLTLGIWLWSLVFARAPYRLTQHSEEEAQGDTETQEAQSILSILPMLTSFTLISIASSMGVMFLLSQAVRRMVWSLLVAGPVMLVCSAFWGWGMSFNSMANQGSETRWACFVSLLLAGFSARMIYTRIQKIDKTIQVIELATTALLAHPALFGLQAALLLAHLILAIPFFSLFCRLLLLHPTNPESPVLWMALHVLLTYLWSLALFRNASKLTTAIALSQWYFNRHEPESPYATSIELVQSAFARARGPQAGTIVLSSLILTLTELSSFTLIRLRNALRKARGTQSLLASFECIAPAIVFLCGVVENISGYAVIWCALTGTGFWSASRRVSGLIRANGMGRTADYLLVKLILSLLSMSFSVFAGLVGLLSANQPKPTHINHILASMLCFFIPWYTVKLCSDLLANAVDVLFVCFNVDQERGQYHSNKAKEAFLGSAPGDDDDSDMV